MAMLAAGLTPELLGSIASQAGNIASAGAAIHHLGQKYMPGIKRVANRFFGSSGRRSARTYLHGLTTAKGLQKAITKDLPSVGKKVVRGIKSGAALKAVEGVAKDVSSVGQAVGRVNSKYGASIQQAVDSGVSGFKGVHHQSEQFLNDFNRHANYR